MLKIRLIDPGNYKIQLVKLVKTYSGLDLIESKEIVDNAPSEFELDIHYTNLEQVIKDFQIYGAKIELVDGRGIDSDNIENEILQDKTFRLKLTDAGSSKIQVIKLIREYTNLGLKESKEIVDQVPSEFELISNSQDISEILENFRKAGAMIEEDYRPVEMRSDKGKEKSVNRKLKIILTNPGNHKLEVIKLIRMFTGAGLKEAKDFVEQVPSLLLIEDEGLTFNQVSKNFNAIGAEIEQVMDVIDNEANKSQMVIPGPAGNTNGINKRESRTLIPGAGIFKEYKELEKPGGFEMEGRLKSQMLNAFIFSSLSAILLAFIHINFNISHVSFIFVIAICISYFLRIKNPPGNKLGMTAFLLVIYYFVLKYIFVAYFWPLGNGYSAIDFADIIGGLLHQSTVFIAIPAGLAWFLAANKSLFKGIDKLRLKNEEKGKPGEFPGERKDIFRHTKKLKF
jgi:ribosomal protein L7/L12